MRARSIPVAILIVAAGCSSPTSVSDGVFTVRRDADALTLINGASSPMFYIALERDAAAAIDWIPCVAASCPAVAAHASHRVPDEDIVGFDPGDTQALVYYWMAVPDGEGGVKPGDVKSFLIDL